jgi:hypothetical protein
MIDQLQTCTESQLLKECKGVVRRKKRSIKLELSRYRDSSSISNSNVHRCSNISKVDSIRLEAQLDRTFSTTFSTVLHSLQALDLRSIEVQFTDRAKCLGIHLAVLCLVRINSFNSTSDHSALEDSLMMMLSETSSIMEDLVNLILITLQPIFLRTSDHSDTWMTSSKE